MALREVTEDISAWANVCLVKDIESSVSRSDLVQSFCRWLGREVERSMFFTTLGRFFSSEYFSSVSKHSGKKGGKKVIFYVGIKLKETSIPVPVIKLAVPGVSSANELISLDSCDKVVEIKDVVDKYCKTADVDLEESLVDDVVAGDQEIGGEVEDMSDCKNSSVGLGSSFTHTNLISDEDTYSNHCLEDCAE